MSTEETTQPKKILLAAPMYSQGHVSMGLMQSVMHCGIDQTGPYQLEFQYGASSALCYSFNNLWAHALNQRPIDYFCLLHSDVFVQPGWLPRMIEEMEENDLDALSAVIAIKDATGDTSTAYYKPNGDIRRFNYTEPAKLPNVITNEHCGPDNRLLINTGVFLVNFQKPWVEKWAFTFQDQIVMNPNNGRYEARMISEDWHFSLWAHQLGLKIGATQTPEVLHLGERLYSSPKCMQAIDAQVLGKAGLQG